MYIIVTVKERDHEFEKRAVGRMWEGPGEGKGKVISFLILKIIKQSLGN